MSDWDSQRKAILPYLQRAVEIEGVDKKVAYYCRLYAVEQGIKLEQRDQRADDLLELVLNQLEKDKPHIQLDQQADKEHCERFALNILVKAKRRDEQGVADRDTAKAYYAAFNFVEILKQFGKLSSEVEKERRFAVFRAAAIKKALDEGRDPPPWMPSQSSPRDEDQESGSGAKQPGSNSEPAEDTIPLIEYDPGYVEGSKVIFVQHETGTISTGVVAGKAQLVGGFFRIEATDGVEFNLGALFLAPDLSEGGSVTYFYPDGRQAECDVVSMSLSKWPPTYTLQMKDGSRVDVKHSHFVLNPDPVPQEDPKTLEESVKEEETEELKEEVKEEEEKVVPAALDLNPEEKKVYQKQTSWLKRRGRNPSVESNTNTEVAAANLRTASSLEANAQALSGLHTQDSIQSTTIETQSSIQSRKPGPPRNYYEVINEENVEYAYSPTVQVKNYSAVRTPKVQSNEAITSPTQNYELSKEALDSARRSTQNASTALSFNDVDHAIKCLNEALACLTKGQSS